MSSIALLAADVAREGEIAAAVLGGRRIIKKKKFDASTLEPQSELRNAGPAEAARLVSADLVVGSGAREQVEARGWGEARESWPSAANAQMLPDGLRNLPPKPVYARAPDARVPEAA